MWGSGIWHALLMTGPSYSWLGFSEKFILSIFLITLHFTSYVVTQNVNILFETLIILVILHKWLMLTYGTNHIQLNGMKRDNCVGRVLHKEKVQFQEPNSKKIASFNTFFTFSMNNNRSNHSEDGFAFLILPNNSASNFEQLWWTTWPCQCCKQWKCQQSFVCN